MKKPVFSRNVKILSLISLLNIASEMLYPVIPIYLQSIGFSMAAIGILEGIAEATAGLSKGYFGQLSDITGKRLPLVRIGYLLSVISKPLMVLFTVNWWVLMARTLDRFGKGIRTGARDALLSDETTSSNKGRVFGFYRAADTVAAFAGPTVALVYLHFYPAKYELLFYIAFFPGFAAYLFTYRLKEKKREKLLEMKISFFSFLKYWKKSPVNYRLVVGGLIAFTILNSSDMFLLLKAKDSGMNDAEVIGLYILYNFCFSILSYPIGVLADRIGLRNTLTIGFLVYAAVYAGMAFADSRPEFIVLFLLYGVFAAAHEGIAKAWISNIAEEGQTATALGTYAGLNSIFTMLASTLTGLLWYSLGAKFTFMAIAAFAVCIVFYFLWVNRIIKAAVK